MTSFQIVSSSQEIPKASATLQTMYSNFWVHQHGPVPSFWPPKVCNNGEREGLEDFNTRLETCQCPTGRQWEKREESQPKDMHFPWEYSSTLDGPYQKQLDLTGRRMRARLCSLSHVISCTGDRTEATANPDKTGPHYVYKRPPYFKHSQLIAKLLSHQVLPTCSLASAWSHSPYSMCLITPL